MSNYLELLYKKFEADWPALDTHVNCKNNQKYYDNKLGEIYDLAKTGNKQVEYKANLNNFDKEIGDLVVKIKGLIDEMSENYLGYKMNKRIINDKWPIYNNGYSCTGCEKFDKQQEDPNNPIVFCQPKVMYENDVWYGEAKSKGGGNPAPATCWNLNQVLNNLELNTTLTIKSLREDNEAYSVNGFEMLKNFNCLDKILKAFESKNTELKNIIQKLELTAKKKKDAAAKKYSANENLVSLNLGAKAQMEFAVFQYRRDLVKIISLASLIIYWIVLLNMRKKQ